MKIFIIESKWKERDCYESFVVIAKNKSEAEEIALSHYDYLIKKWWVDDNFRENGYEIREVELDKPKVIHSSFFG